MSQEESEHNEVDGMKKGVDCCLCLLGWHSLFHSIVPKELAKDNRILGL